MHRIFHVFSPTGEDSTTLGIRTTVTEDDVTDPEADTTNLTNLVTTKDHGGVATSTPTQDAWISVTSDAATTDKTGTKYKTCQAQVRMLYWLSVSFVDCERSNEIFKHEGTDVV